MILAARAAKPVVIVSIQLDDLVELERYAMAVMRDWVHLVVTPHEEGKGILVEDITAPAPPIALSESFDRVWCEVRDRSRSICRHILSQLQTAGLPAAAPVMMIGYTPRVWVDRTGDHLAVEVSLAVDRDSFVAETTYRSGGNSGTG